MNISVSYYSEIGGRKRNEDAVSMHESNDSIIGIVADGLGGHAGGEIASKIAINAINLEIAHKPIAVQSLKKSIEIANKLIVQDAENLSMKTTIAVVWFDEKNALTANVGDTRIYQFRDDEIIFQTIDQQSHPR